MERKLKKALRKNLFLAKDDYFTDITSIEILYRMGIYTKAISLEWASLRDHIYQMKCQIKMKYYEKAEVTLMQLVRLIETKGYQLRIRQFFFI